MSDEQTPFDRAVAAAAAEMRQELEDARAKVMAEIKAERMPWWKKFGRGTNGA